MCGIAGVIYEHRERTVARETLVRMRDALVHRGPDDQGVFVAHGIGLAARRLAILDLSERGHQPMSTADGRYTIVHNGEVYNYRELRTRLEQSGVTFRSNSDTEVLLALYAAEGPDMLGRLNGMFAFALWDAEERTLFMARDRLGVKPLYFATWDGGLWFASEQKALFAAGVPAAFDEATWPELLCFRYVAGERTPFVGIQRLLPGHSLLWKDGKSQSHRWWNLPDRVRQLREQPPDDPSRWFRETFDSAVALRRISDVPVGVLLSGGLDSGSVAASLAAQAGDGVASFTVRFSEPEYDEGPLARQVADRWRLEYHDLVVPPGELLTRLRRASWLNDEPLAQGSDLHLWAMAEYAKPRVTVLLSGEGSDETLGGYIRYQPLRYPRLVSAARPAIARLASAFGGAGRFGKLERFLALGALDRFVLFNACDVLPVDLARHGAPTGGRFDYREQVLDEARDLYPGEPMRQAMYSDLSTHLCSLLDRNDRMTMGASIECRVPFLDYRLVEGLAALSSSRLFVGLKPKSLLRRAIGERLPRAVLRHRKWGFGVPWGQYLREIPELRELVHGLPELRPVRDGLLPRPSVSKLVDAFLRGDRHGEALVKQLLAVAIWYEASLS